MKQTIIALVTAGICTWWPFHELPVLTRWIGIAAVYMCVRFFILDIANAIREKRRKRRFTRLIVRSTLPGKEHTLSIGRKVA